MNAWTIVTVTYNSADHLAECWGATRMAGVRWIVVDNNSHDCSVEVARRLGAEVVSLEGNFGFSVANNVGLAKVKSEWTLFVNPDVTVNLGDLPRLQAVAAANGALVAPQLVNADGSPQPNARGLPYLTDKLAHRNIPAPGSRLEEYVRPPSHSPTYVAWVMGAAVGGSTESLRRMGGWDEAFFLYYEDHELGLRAWERGIPVVIDPAVRWAHQWQRETTRVNVSAWRREIAAASTFYRRRPYLLSRRWSRLPVALDRLGNALWREAIDA